MAIPSIVINTRVRIFFEYLYNTSAYNGEKGGELLRYQLLQQSTYWPMVA